QRRADRLRERHTMHLLPRRDRVRSERGAGLAGGHIRIVAFHPEPFEIDHDGLAKEMRDAPRIVTQSSACCHKVRALSWGQNFTCSDFFSSGPTRSSSVTQALDFPNAHIKK